MENQVAVIDPSQFGIEENTATGIEQAFAPAIAKRNELQKTFEIIIAKEITPELCEEAKEFDKVLLENEKEIIAIHKVEKNFSLQYGRLVDAHKNKNLEPLKQMREPMIKLKKHAELELAKRVADLQSVRKVEMDAYGFEGDLNLGELSETVYKGILQGAKLTFEKNAEDARLAEEERVEAARVEAIKAERDLRLAPYTDLAKEDGLSFCMLRESSEEVFQGAIIQLSNLRAKKDQAAAADRAEVKRLADELAEKEAAEKVAKDAQIAKDEEVKAERDAVDAKLQQAQVDLKARENELSS